jgi:hypothetical protein
MVCPGYSLEIADGNKEPPVRGFFPRKSPWFENTVAGKPTVLHQVLVGGLEPEFYFSMYWEFHHTN